MSPSDEDLYKLLSEFDADGSSWPMFKYKFELFLEAKSLLHIVKFEEDTEANAGTSELARARAVKRVTDSAKVKSYLVNKLPDSSVNLIRDKETAFKMFEALTNQYESNTMASSVSRLDRLLDSLYKEGSDISSHIGNISALITQIREAGGLDMDKLHVVVLLRSMPKTSDWSTTVTALKMMDEGTLTKEKVARVLTERARDLKESKKKVNGSSGGEKLAFVGGSKYCPNCKKLGHTKQDCFSPGGGKEGQWPPHLKHRRKDNDSRAKSISGSSHFTFTNAKKENYDQNGYYLDSGATKHYVRDRNDLHDYEVIQDTCTVGSGDDVEVIGRGTLIMEMRLPDGKTNTVTFKEVNHAPEMIANLISSSRLDKGDTSLVQKNGQTTVFSNEQTVFQAVKTQIGLYKINGIVKRSNESGAALISTSKTSLWHRRMGHLGFDNLKRLANEDLVHGEIKLDGKEEMVCETCAMGKQTRRTFETSINPHSKYPLDLVHIDIVVLNIRSRLNEKYALALTDDMSSAKFVFPLEKKSDAVVKLKEWLPWAQRMTDRKLKCIRSDNAQEFIQGNMQKFLSSIAVEQQVTQAYEHEQNGKIERAIRTLLEKARCMLLESGLPKAYWRDAITAAAFVANRSPVKGLKMTPIELFTGIKPTITKIRVFGTTCWARRPTEFIGGRNKLNSRSIKAKLLGYTQGGHSYLLIDQEGRIFESTNVKNFDEFYVGKPAENAIARKVTSRQCNWDVDLTSDSEEEEINTVGSEGTDTVVRGGEDSESGEDEAPTTPTSALPTEPPPRRSTRVRYKPVDYWDSAAVKTPSRRNYREPSESPVNLVLLTAREALKSDEAEMWKKAMQREFNTLQKFGTWKLQELPPGRKAIGCKWHLVKKKDFRKPEEEYKARLVALGNHQQEGIDYFHTFAAVARLPTIRLILLLAVEHDMQLDQLDIIAAYLNGYMGPEDEIYVLQPPGFEDGTRRVCKLIRGLYGTKQAGRIWNIDLNKTLLTLGFTRTKADNCLYIKGSMQNLQDCIIIVVYVDDIILCYHEKNRNTAKSITDDLGKKYQIKILGDIRRYLGSLVVRNRLENSLTISQSDYVNEILERFGMEDAKGKQTPMEVGCDLRKRQETEAKTNKPYRELMGALMYLAICTRPDISQALGVLSRHLENPTDAHWNAGIRVLRYVVATKEFGIKYTKSERLKLVGYSDADWAGDKEDGKSTSGYLIMLGGNLITWKSKKQKVTSTSTAMSEIEAMYYGITELIWIQMALTDLGVQLDGKSAWYSDSQSAINAVKSERNVERTRHILTKICFIRDQVEQGMELLFVPTKEMKADILTKPLTHAEFSRQRDELGIREQETLLQVGNSVRRSVGKESDSGTQLASTGVTGGKGAE
jgi:hypothetical protein